MRIFKTEYNSFGDTLFKFYFMTEQLAKNYIESKKMETNEINWDIEEIDIIENLNIFDKIEVNKK